MDSGIRINLSTMSKKVLRSVYIIIYKYIGYNLIPVMFLSFLSTNSYRLSVLEEVLI
jgi:hypothetical protein